MLAVGAVDGRFGAPRSVNGDRGSISSLTPTPQGAVALIASQGQPELSASTSGINAAGAVGATRDVGLREPDFRDRVVRGADGTLAIAQGSQVVIRTPSGRWRRVRSPFGRGAADAQAAIAPDGRISVVAVKVSVGGEVANYGRIVIAELPKGARRFGPLRRASVRPARRPYAFGPAVAYDGRGRRVVTWIEDTKPDAGLEQEEAFGDAISWTRASRRTRLRSQTGDVQLLTVPGGVLATQQGRSWRTSLFGARGQMLLSGPSGGVYTSEGPRAIASSGARTVFAWRGKPDGGIVALLRP